VEGAERQLSGGLTQDELTKCVYICILTEMAPKVRYNFWLEIEKRDALRLIKDQQGIPESEQIRRAVDAWLESKGVIKKADRKRVAPRSRS
jgi:hypothetical protein